MIDEFNYQRIEKAIYFLYTHYKRRPSLPEVAKVVHLSPYHFQRLFTKWAGVSPKKFTQFLSIEYAKHSLRTNNVTLADVAFEAGYSSTSRLHDLFVNIESMTPGEYKDGGQELVIRYSFEMSPFGMVSVGSTTKGVCHLSFVVESQERALSALHEAYPNAQFYNGSDNWQQQALSIFSDNKPSAATVKLHLKGSPFQLKVWQALLNVPSGSLTTYQQIAGTIEQPNACRAVGSAVGQNPVAYIIPCHRVIKSAGAFGQYRWTEAKKTVLIGWEAARLHNKPLEHQETISSTEKQEPAF